MPSQFYFPLYWNTFWYFRRSCIKSSIPSQLPLYPNIYKTRECVWGQLLGPSMHKGSTYHQWEDNPNVEAAEGRTDSKSLQSLVTWTLKSSHYSELFVESSLSSHDLLGCTLLQTFRGTIALLKRFPLISSDKWVKTMTKSLTKSIVIRRFPAHHHPPPLAHLPPAHCQKETKSFQQMNQILKVFSRWTEK